MERNALDALADFSAGCFFASLLVSGAILYMARGRSRLHAVAAAMFAWLVLMNVVLFALIYVRNVLGTHFEAVTNLYQATCIPMCVCLLYGLARPGFLTLRALSAHIVPALVPLALYALFPNHTLYVVCMSLLACYGLAGMLWAGDALRRYNRGIRQWCSYTEGVDVSWVFYVLASFALLYVVWLLASYHGLRWVNALYNFCCSAIFVFVAWCLRTHEVVMCADGVEDDAQAETSACGMPPARHFTEEFRRAFDEGQVFLTPRLTLTLLAERLHTNRTYLSAYINQGLHTNFYDYVNRYRVEYAKRLLVSQESTMEAVALRSGFNSLSTFTRVFVSTVGISPSQYRKAHAGGALSST